MARLVSAVQFLAAVELLELGEVVGVERFDLQWTLPLILQANASRPFGSGIDHDASRAAVR